MKSIIRKALSFQNDGRFIQSGKIIMNKVVDLNSRKDYAGIDTLIDAFTANEFSVKICIGFLAMTTTIRENLTGYDNLYEYSILAACNDGYSMDEAKELLDGWE